MPERDKVIQKLEECLSASCCGFRTCPYSDDVWDTVREALTLLKERKPVVRCKNCKHYNTACCADGCGWCDLHDFGTHDEWYCADGNDE